MPRTTTATTILILALAAGCGHREPSPVVTDPAPAAAIAEASGPAGNPLIPPGISYAILRDEDVDRTEGRRSVGVRLNAKVAEDVLREIAREVKATEKRPYERTFIDFSLPRVTPDAPDHTWARAVFYPKLELNITGLTIEQERAFRSMPLDAGPGVVGNWLVELSHSAELVTIREAGPDAQLEERTEPGREPFVRPLAEIPAAVGRRFRRPGSDQEYDVDRAGVLRIYGNNNELFASAKPLPRP